MQKNQNYTFYKKRNDVNIVKPLINAPSVYFLKPPSGWAVIRALRYLLVLVVPVIMVASKIFGVYYDFLSEKTQEAVAHSNDVVSFLKIIVEIFYNGVF